MQPVRLGETRNFTEYAPQKNPDTWPAILLHTLGTITTWIEWNVAKYNHRLCGDRPLPGRTWWRSFRSRFGHMPWPWRSSHRALCQGASSCPPSASLPAALPPALCTHQTGKPSPQQPPQPSLYKSPRKNNKKKGKKELLCCFLYSWHAMFVHRSLIQDRVVLGWLNAYLTLVAGIHNTATATTTNNNIIRGEKTRKRKEITIVLFFYNWHAMFVHRSLLRTAWRWVGWMPTWHLWHVPHNTTTITSNNIMEQIPRKKKKERTLVLSCTTYMRCLFIDPYPRPRGVGLAYCLLGLTLVASVPCNTPWIRHNIEFIHKVSWRWVNHGVWSIFDMYSILIGFYFVVCWS